MAAFYFLPEDFAALNARIAELRARLREIGAEMGKSCQEGAETFHDNFAYEDGERQQRMWSRLRQELVRIRDGARVVCPGGEAAALGIGQVVQVRDEAGQVHRYRIGSYMVFDGEETLSYDSPLGRLLVGAREGEVREGQVGRRHRCFEVLSVA